MVQFRMYHLLEVPSRVLQSRNTTEQGSTRSIGCVQQNRSFHLSSYDRLLNKYRRCISLLKKPSLQKLAESK